MIVSLTSASDGIVATARVAVSDPTSVLDHIDFYTTVLPSGPRLGPFPSDATTGFDTFEKDVVLMEMLDGLRPFVSRVVGAVVGALAGMLSTRIGIQVDPSTQASITTAVVVGAYGVAHKVLDKKLNPADSASKKLAVAGRAESTRL